MSKRRRLRPDLFRKDFEMIRIPLCDDGESDRSQADLGDKRALILQSIVTAHEGKHSQQTIADAAFLTRRHYIAHYMTNEGYTKDDATKKYDRDIGNVAIQRSRNEAREETIGVRLLVVNRAVASASWRRVVHGSEAVDDDSTKDSFSKTLNNCLMQEPRAELQALADVSLRVSGVASIGDAGLAPTQAKKGALGAAPGSPWGCRPPTVAATLLRRPTQAGGR